MEFSQASTSLHHAVSKAHLEGVRQVLKSDLPGLVNAPCEKSRVTPLHRAAFVGSEEVVYELLRAGADVEARNHTKIGCTALYYGAEKGHVGVVRALLENGACPDVLQSNGWSALVSAAQGGHHEVIKALLEFGANVDEQTKDMRTPLHVAAEGGHAKAVQTLLEAGADINACDSMGWNALNFATENARAPVVQLLLNYGATTADSQKVLPSDLTPASSPHRSPVATSALYPIVGDTASPATTGALSPHAAGTFARPRFPREVPFGSGPWGSPVAAQVIPYHSSPSGSPKRSFIRWNDRAPSPIEQRTMSSTPLAVGEEVSFPLQRSSPVSPDSTCVITVSHRSGGNAVSPGYLAEKPAAKGVEDEAAAPAPASTAQGMQTDMDSMKQDLSALRSRLSDTQMQGLNINSLASAISQELSQGLLANFHKQIAASRKRQDETGQVLSAQQALLETVLAEHSSVEKAKDREVLCQEIADEVCNDERVIGVTGQVQQLRQELTEIKGQLRQLGEGAAALRSGVAQEASVMPSQCSPTSPHLAITCQEGTSVLLESLVVANGKEHPKGLLDLPKTLDVLSSARCSPTLPRLSAAAQEARQRLLAVDLINHEGLPPPHTNATQGSSSGVQPPPRVSERERGPSVAESEGEYRWDRSYSTVSPQRSMSVEQPPPRVSERERGPSVAESEGEYRWDRSYSTVSPQRSNSVLQPNPAGIERERGPSVAESEGEYRWDRSYSTVSPQRSMSVEQPPPRVSELEWGMPV